MSGGRYSKIHRRMWHDDKFRRLSKPQACGQALWFRFLCGPELGPIPGLFAAREPGLADSLGWSLKPFRESFHELSSNGMAKADWNAGLVWVPKAIQYNEPANPNVVKSWADSWAELPECSLKSEAFSVLCKYLQGRGELFLKVFLNHCPNHSANHCPNQEQEQDQEQEQEQEQESPQPPVGGQVQLAMVAESSGHNDSASVREVFDHYRTYHPRSFPSPASDSKEWVAIRRRIGEGYTVADLCRAIDGYHKSPYHCGENQSGTKYLGLGLIVRDGTHVANGMGYADAAGGPVMSERERRSQRAGEGFLAKLEALGMGGNPNGQE